MMSDNYFDLITAVPRLADYFAVGEYITVVHNGIAYAIVPGEVSGPVTIPESEDGVQLITPKEAEVYQSEGSEVEPIEQAEPVLESEPRIEITTDAPPTSNAFVYVSIVALILLLSGLIFGRMRFSSPA